MLIIMNKIKELSGWSNYYRLPGWPSTNNGVEGGVFNNFKNNWLHRK